MGRLNEAEVLYGKLSNGGRPEYCEEYEKIVDRGRKKQEG
jgi:hypothetical protein